MDRTDRPRLTRREAAVLLALILHGSAWLTVLAIRPSWWALAGCLAAYTSALAFPAALAAVPGHHTPED